MTPWPGSSDPWRVQVLGNRVLNSMASGVPDYLPVVIITVYERTLVLGLCVIS